MLSSVVWSDYITYGFVISIITAVVISQINYWFGYIPALYPPNLRQFDDQFRQWKWRNFLISFIHSLITGFGSLLCIIYRPWLLVEVIDEYLELSYLITSFSHGYFIYDLIEMITHLQYKGSKELVIHHIMILCCFSLTVFGQKYCGYSSIALLIELSNIFLHFRQLLLIAGIPKTSKVYQKNCYLNIIMFVLVRGLCLFWLWLTLFWVLPRVPIFHQTIAFTSLIGICLMTCVLYLRIYNSDFTSKSKMRDKSCLNGITCANQSPTAQTNDTEKQSNGLTTNPKAIDMHSKAS